MTEKDRLIWIGGKVVKVADAKVNVLSPMAQFGANVFEGIRCYWNTNDQQLYAFRLQEHHRRLKNSIRLLGIEDKYSKDELVQSVVDIIVANDYKEDVAVRQTVFIDGFGSWASTGPVNMFVAPIAKGRSWKTSANGLRCCISTWERISDRNLPPRIKLGANYMNSRMAQLEAATKGFESCILLNSNGKVSEGPGSCFFMVRDETIITPPGTASVLESITRSTILELASDLLNIKVVEREIDRTELYICDEAFLCGSAVEVMPIENIDGFDIGTLKNNSITLTIRDIYLETVYGEIAQYRKWLTPIYYR